MSAWCVEAAPHRRHSCRSCRCYCIAEPRCRCRPQHLPEGVFGENWLHMVHEESGVCVRFDVAGALMKWVLLSCEHGSGGLKVMAASVGGWAEEWPAMFQTQEYDWTYGTNYRGDATVPRAGEPSEHAHASDATARGVDWGQAPAVQSAQSAQAGLPCSLPECAAEEQKATEQRGGSKGVDELEWEDCAPGLIDMELLVCNPSRCFSMFC